MENTANRIDLRGDLVALPVLSHENHGQKFYRFFLDVARLSGTADRLPVIAAQSVLEEMDLSAGSRITVTGQVRSYHVRTEARRKLLLFVYAQSLQTSDAAPLNDVFLSGTICKPPVCRRTPLGRQICDVILAVPRPYRRADYLPCILWGRNAAEAAAAAVGDELELTGRLQSRQYTKRLGETAETRTAYAVSALSSHVLEYFSLEGPAE